MNQGLIGSRFLTFSMASLTSQTSVTSSASTTSCQLRTVGIDHEDTASGTGILSFDGFGINGLAVFRHVGGVVDDAPDQLTSTKIIGGISTDFELLSVKPVFEAYLEVVETLVEAALDQGLDLFIRVTEPACGSGVRRVATFRDFRFSSLLATLIPLEELKCFFGSNGIGNVAESSGFNESADQ